MKPLSFLLIFFFTFSYGYSQNTITGRVTTEGGQPLIGVTVIVAKSKKGAVTDTEGNYSISTLPNGEVKLVANYLGYQTAEKTLILANSSQIVDFILQEN